MALVSRGLGLEVASQALLPSSPSSSQTEEQDPVYNRTTATTTYLNKKIKKKYSVLDHETREKKHLKEEMNKMEQGTCALTKA